jgi:hypothetical protein
MRSLAEQAAQWGAISIGRLQEELIRDISEPLMRRRFGVETEGQGGFQSASGDSPTKGVVTTGDLITLVNDPQRGLLAKAVPVSKLIELGVKVDERNLANLNKMILDLNRKLIVGLNAYARAIGKLEPGQTRSGIIDDIKALMRGVEPPPSPAN